MRDLFSSSFFQDFFWLIQCALIILFTLVLAFIEKKVYYRVLPKVKKSSHLWGSAVLQALHTPLILAIWVFGMLLVAQVAFQAALNKSLWEEVFVSLRTAVMALVLVWFLVRLIREIEQSLSSSHLKFGKIDETTLHAVGQILRIAVFIAASLILLPTLGIPVGGILAFGGIGGVAIGFAAKDLLANFFGGLMIFLDRPFKIGDWIRSPDKEIEGTVEYIGWRLTRIRTFDKRPLFIPNSLFSTISIENPSRMMNRRIKEVIGLRYQDAEKIEGILQEVEKMLKNHPEIDTNKTYFVALTHFGSFALEFTLYAFTKTTDWISFQKIQQDVFLKILHIIHQKGASCASSTMFYLPEEIRIQSRP